MRRLDQRQTLLDQQLADLEGGVSQHTQILTDQTARLSATEMSLDAIMARLATVEGKLRRPQ